MRSKCIPSYYEFPTIPKGKSKAIEIGTPSTEKLIKFNASVEVIKQIPLKIVK